MVGPPPTTKPPTPPQVVRGNTGTLGKSAGNTGTLGKSSREYRTPPVVIPPQVPSHYAPNYPLGHPRRSGGSERGPGYSALPVQSNQQQITTHHQVNHVRDDAFSLGVRKNFPNFFSISLQQVLAHNNLPPPPSNYDERHSMPRKIFHFLGYFYMNSRNVNHSPSVASNSHP